MPNGREAEDRPRRRRRAEGEGEGERERSRERGDRERRDRQTGTQTNFWSVVDDHWDKLERAFPWVAIFGTALALMTEKTGAGREFIRQLFLSTGDFLGARKRSGQRMMLRLAVFGRRSLAEEGPVNRFFRDEINPALDRYIEVLRQRREQRRAARQDVRRNIFGVRVRS